MPIAGGYWRMSSAEKVSAVVIGASGGIGGAFEAALIEESAFHAAHGFARSRGGPVRLDLLDEVSIAATSACMANTSFWQNAVTLQPWLR